VHRLPTAVKLVTALAVVGAVVAWPPEHVVYLVVLAVLLVVVAALSRIPVGFIVRRLLLLEPLVLGVGLLAAFQPGGWRLLLVLMARCTLCLLSMILLANTTPFGEMLHLLRRIWVPGMLITTLALMYRYLFVLADERQRMVRARKCRTFQDGRAGKWRQWRTLATVISQLFLRASERAERIFAAMCARGWQ